MTVHIPGRHQSLLQGEQRWLTLPAGKGDNELGLRAYWSGLAWQLGTAAFWEAAAKESPAPSTHRLGETLAEEVGACLLGGHGMPFWLANAAYERLRDADVFNIEADPVPVTDIERLLTEPLRVRDSTRRYRFPKQRAERIATAMAHVRATPEPDTDREVRDWLQGLPGIGPKTASWIVRNYRHSDNVAIIDIHLIRAGIVVGVFDDQWRLPRDYHLYESAFLGWAAHAELRASDLDAYVWGVLANDSHGARDILGLRHLNDPPQPVWSNDAV